MKLIRREKYQSVTGNKKTIIFVILIFFVFSSDLFAQAYKISFNNTPLSDALVQISGKLGIKVAFDSKKLGSITISRDVTGNTHREVISDLLRGTGFDFRVKYDRYLITEKDSKVNNPGYQLVGCVSDRLTDEHLPYATVSLFNENLFASTSENGSFCFKNIDSSHVHLMVSYIGYNSLDTTITMDNHLANFNFRLSRRLENMGTVVVEATRNEMVDLRNDVDFATTIDPSRLNDLPVLSETDVFRMLQLIPGISYTENARGISIRGGAGDQNLVLFDGQVLYNLSHCYGLVSALNPNVIKDMQVYKGGFDSRFGERVSGIVDITGKTGNQSRPIIYGDLNLLSANITTEIPIGKKISFIGAARRSYSDIYSTGLSNKLYDQNMTWFHGDSVKIIDRTRPKYYFYDYNAKLTFRPDDMESFSISTYGGKDFFKNAYSGEASSLMILSNDNNTWSNYGISANWLKQWNSSFYSTLQAGSSGYENISSNTTTIDRTYATHISPAFLPSIINTFNTYNNNRLQDLFISSRNNYRISNRNQSDFGFLIRKNTIYYHKDAEKVYVYDNMNQEGWVMSLFLQDRMTIAEKLTLKTGIRLSYCDNSGLWYAEPRFSAYLKATEAFSVRVATGRYYQFINQVTAQQETGYNKNFWVMADGKDHPVVASNHYIAGLTAEKGRFLLDAEVYYKTFTGVQEYVFLSQFFEHSDFPDYFPGSGTGSTGPKSKNASFYVTGTGKSYGIDLMLRYKGRIYASWLSYSFGNSRQRFPKINSGGEIPAPADEPFQLSWTNMISMDKWNFGTILLYSAGRPYIDYTSSSIHLPVERKYKRLPDYFRTDISVNRSFSLGKAKFKGGIAFINIFNTQNYFDVNTRKFDFVNTSFSETTLIQSQPFTINMFIHFVI
jgi:ferric enterobactin receptor